MDGMRLLAVSPVSETHHLLVGQRLDGWPEVELLDAHGVIVRDVPVRFGVSGEVVTFEHTTGGILDRDTDNRGRAIALGLYGHSAGEATVAVTVPSSPDTAALLYTVLVTGSG